MRIKFPILLYSLHPSSSLFVTWLTIFSSIIWIILQHGGQEKQISLSCQKQFKLDWMSQRQWKLHIGEISFLVHGPHPLCALTVCISGVKLYCIWYDYDNPHSYMNITSLRAISPTIWLVLWIHANQIKMDYLKVQSRRKKIDCLPLIVQWHCK